jgi:hypothetical protein
MNKKQHLNTINDLKIVLKQNNLLQQFSISRLGVFGSFARNEIARIPYIHSKIFCCYEILVTLLYATHRYLEV